MSEHIPDDGAREMLQLDSRGYSPDMVEALAFTLYWQDAVCPIGGTSIFNAPETAESSWRDDSELRDNWRMRALAVLGSLEDRGVGVVVKKKKVLADAVTEIITIPARQAYRL